MKIQHRQHGPFLFLLVSVMTGFSAGSDTEIICQAECPGYNAIINSCSFFDGIGTEELYNSCVCQNSNFTNAIAPCVECTGPGSAAVSFLSTCSNVAEDCTRACYDFFQTLESCAFTGGTSSVTNTPEKRDGCVCQSAYEKNDPTSFNQNFTKCTGCTGSKGPAVAMENTCVKLGFGSGNLTTAPTSTANGHGSSSTITAGSAATSSAESTGNKTGSGSDARFTIPSYNIIGPIFLGTSIILSAVL